MTDQLKLVRLNESSEMFLVYQGDTVIAYLVAVDGNGQHIEQILGLAPERRVRASGFSGIKTAERLDQLLGDDEVPTRRLRIPGSKY